MLTYFFSFIYSVVSLLFQGLVELLLLQFLEKSDSWVRGQQTMACLQVQPTACFCNNPQAKELVYIKRDGGDAIETVYILQILKYLLCGP